MSTPDLSRTDIQDDSARSGRSLVPLIEQESGSVEDVPIVAETFRPQAGHNLRAVIDGDSKLILNTDTQQTMLYDLALDPNELQDQAGTQPALESALTQTMTDLVEGAVQRTPSENELTEEQLRRLRSLGYVR